MDFRKLVPQYITVQGREGMNSVINGTYRLGEFTHCGKPFYNKIDPKDDETCVIRWHSGGIWMFGPKLSYDSQGFACVKDNCLHPGLVTYTWRVFNDYGFETDTEIRVTYDENETSVLEMENKENSWENEKPRNSIDAIERSGNVEAEVYE